MKRICNCIGSLLLCMALLTGCTFRPASSVPAAPAAAADPLTGLEARWPGQRPVAVTIENRTDSTTQWGLSIASLVLEARTRAYGSTSLCLVYPALDAMPQVGPVTQGEDLYWRLLVGQQVLPVQRGGGTFDQNYLDYYSLRAVDALEVGRNAFSCDAAWANAPLWYTNGGAVAGVLSSLNISSALTESRVTGTTPAQEGDASSGEATLTVPPLLPQAVDGKVPDATAPGAVNVRICFDEENATGFAYDEASGRYQMLHADGTPQLDANSGRPAAFDNLLVLFSASSLRDDGQTYDYDLTMGGGFWLNGGHLWYLTWTQGSDSTFQFYDADGQPLTLEAGTSYLALVSSITGQELTVTNAAGENLIQ